MLNYAQQMALRLAAGVEGIDEAVRGDIAAFLLAAQNDDGGFSGRKGASDLYYTGFGLRGLALLGELAEEPAGRAAAFLESRLGDDLPSIDFLSLVFGAVLLDAAAGVDVFADAGVDPLKLLDERLEPMRREDGGYAKTPKGVRASTYHTFLVLLARQLVGAEIREPEALIELIRLRRREDGGFVEVTRLPRGGTNPTAAAIGVLQMLDALDGESRDGAIRFLTGMQTREGGLRANTQIPAADLLSTFTGLQTLDALNARDAVDREAVRQYVLWLRRPDGGFSAGIWDDATDVEYTFYGLGALALLSVGG